MIDLKELVQDQAYKFADIELDIASAVQLFMADTFGAEPENIYSTMRLSLSEPVAGVEGGQVTGKFDGRLMWKKNSVMVTEGFQDKLREVLGQHGMVASLDVQTNLVKYELEVPIVEFGAYIKEEPAPEEPVEEAPAEEAPEKEAAPAKEEEPLPSDEDRAKEEAPPAEEKPKEVPKEVPPKEASPAPPKEEEKP